MLKLPAFVRWTSRRPSAPPSEDSLEAFASERSVGRPASAPDKNGYVGGRSAAAGLLAFGVLPALVIGGYALDVVARRSEAAPQTWADENIGSDSPVQRVAFVPPPAVPPASPTTSGSTRPSRTPRANPSTRPVAGRRPAASPVRLEPIPQAQLIGLAEAPSPARAEAPRRPSLPELAEGTYEDGKAAFEGGRYERARDIFQRVVGIIDSLPAEERTALADLRLLATGFVDLAGAKIPAPAPIDTVPGLPPPRVDYVGPVAVQEDLPPWMPPAGPAGGSEYAGVFRIRIGVDGRVTGSEVLEASHPVYDAKLSRAARDWLYRPATRDGRPVPSVKDIQIRLVPR